ncbi:MAG: 30S ribosomal protein S6 [Tissierellia bacterium]|nr:30S ribosomal protein S6 [Tissierellia bacterium]
MRKYEGVFIFLPNLEEEDREQIFDRLKGVIESHGSITKIDEWGNRKLAYEIDDLTEGYYIVVEFEAETSTIDELDRICKITDGVMRNMIIRVDE